MAACTACSAEIRNGAQFCWRCGSFIVRPAAEAGAVEAPKDESPRSNPRGKGLDTLPGNPALDGAAEGEIVGTMPPVAAPLFRSTSIMAAGAALHPSGLPLFKTSRDETQPRTNATPRDAAPQSSGQAAPAPDEADSEQPVSPAAEQEQESHSTFASVGNLQSPEVDANPMEAAPINRVDRASRTGWRRWGTSALAGALAFTVAVLWYASDDDTAPDDLAAPTETEAHAPAAAPLEPMRANSGTSQAAPSSNGAANAGVGSTNDGGPPEAAVPLATNAAPDAPMPSDAAPITPRATKPARGGTARKRSARPPAVTAVAPPVVEEAPAVIEATPAPREPEPMPTPVAKGPCDDLTGLRLQQCQACNGLGPMRKFHCEQLVRDNYCRGRWGSTAGCQREGESGPTGG